MKDIFDEYDLNHEIAEFENQYRIYPGELWSIVIHSVKSLL